MNSADETTTIAIAVVQDGERFLIGQRPAGGSLAYYWEFPGGKVLTGETPANAAVRECREETGLEVRAGELLAEIEHTYVHGRLRLYFFACTPTDSACVPEPPFLWVPRPELNRYEFPEANREVISRLLTAG